MIPGSPHEVLLVIDATNGQNAIARLRYSRESIGCTGVILRGLDGIIKGGGRVAVRQTMNLPVGGIHRNRRSVGRSQPFDADTFVESRCFCDRRSYQRAGFQVKLLGRIWAPGTQWWRCRSKVAGLWAKFSDDLWSDPSVFLPLLAAARLQLRPRQSRLRLKAGCKWFKGPGGRVHAAAGVYRRSSWA